MFNTIGYIMRIGVAILDQEPLYGDSTALMKKPYATIGPAASTPSSETMPDRARPSQRRRLLGRTTAAATEATRRTDA